MHTLRPSGSTVLSVFDNAALDEEAGSYVAVPRRSVIAMAPSGLNDFWPISLHADGLDLLLPLCRIGDQ